MKEYVLNLDRPRRLRYDFKAIRVLRERYGKKELQELMDMAIEELPAFAWAGLVWEDPALNPEEVEALLNEKIGTELTIVSIAETVAGALAAHAGMDPGKKAESSTGQQERSGSQPESSKT